MTQDQLLELAKVAAEKLLDRMERSLGVVSMQSPLARDMTDIVLNALQEAQGKWMPIASAPKDRRLIEVKGMNGFSDSYAVAWWYDASQSEEDYQENTGWRGMLVTSGGSVILRLAEPTHWRPLPAPPEAE